MAPKLTLTYFDFAGLAEPIRMALAVSGLEWEDKRLTREEFGALKPSEYVLDYSLYLNKRDVNIALHTWGRCRSVLI